MKSIKNLNFISTKKVYKKTQRVLYTYTEEYTACKELDVIIDTVNYIKTIKNYFVYFL